MQPHTRRIVHAVLYEAVAVGFVGPALAWLFKTSVTTALSLAVLMSTVALAWSCLTHGDALHQPLPGDTAVSATRACT